MTEAFVFDAEAVASEAATAVRELVWVAGLRAGDLFVVGCSSSEIVGGHIGKNSSLEAAEAVYRAIAPILSEAGVYLAVQCCEHLNRALILERAAAERYGYEPVAVCPKPKAGGSLAFTAWNAFAEPVAVEHIRAHAGIDIGGTLIGMHLRDVAVPVRLTVSTIGHANILAARTRPKYIGGPRAQYE
ncbi:MAG: TIGR01440 family protein [Clostridia bacterium]|nr:TIGR01440 family protein [Clostridia bacterium]